jgi:hypothetical protein
MRSMGVTQTLCIGSCPRVAGSAPELGLSPSSLPSSYGPVVASAVPWRALRRHGAGQQAQADRPR